MEIVGCIVIALILCAMYAMVFYVMRVIACKDCPLKHKCEESVKHGDGPLCDNNNHINPLMPI